MGTIGRYYNGDFSFIFDTEKPLYVIFVASALMLILGAYITEPYFSKPSDVIAKSIAMLLVLASLKNPETLIGYTFNKWYSLIIGSAAIISILLLEFPKVARFQRELAVLTTYAGRPKIFFSILYLTGLLSFFSNSVPEYITLLIFWLLLIFSQPIERFTSWVLKFSSFSLKQNIVPLGQAIGFQNPFLYKIEIDLLHNKHHYKKGTKVFLQQEGNIGSVGVVFNIQQLLNKQWLSIYILKDKNNNPLKVDIKKNAILSGSNYIFSKLNQVYLIDSIKLDEAVIEEINSNKLIKNVDNFVGYVSINSNINHINFHIIDSIDLQSFGEGQVLKTAINGTEVLYQVIGGSTEEKLLADKDVYGFTSGKAKKLGIYNTKENELEVVKWLPDIYTPVFLGDKEDLDYEATKFIGKLPNTTLGLPLKDLNSLVTHNTAILGILGIGKSCLTFELLKKLNDNLDELKIICIDITNEYGKEDKLPKYISNELIEKDSEFIFRTIHANYEHIETVGTGTYAKLIPEKSGNINEYRKELEKDLIKFLFNSETMPEEYTPSKNKRIRIYNPDLHKVSQGEKMGIHVLTNPLTQAEKTRIICEETFRILMKFKPTNDLARVLIVFEEAHSLVPEWNSVANEGDKQATNGTAKVILQGRKYGLGSVVITQRTANISKSILNQCNTIFALRVFDDTGKQFLENYIGKDYSDVLPTLEERHAIAVGKAMKLKQPVILELNDLNDIVINQEK